MRTSPGLARPPSSTLAGFELSRAAIRELNAGTLPSWPVRTARRILALASLVLSHIAGASVGIGPRSLLAAALGLDRETVPFACRLVAFPPGCLAFERLRPAGLIRVAPGPYGRPSRPHEEALGAEGVEQRAVVRYTEAAATPANRLPGDHRFGVPAAGFEMKGSAGRVIC